MRISLTAGLLFALVFGSSVAAQAQPHTAKSHVTVALASAEVQSPDVATWTSNSDVLASTSDVSDKTATLTKGHRGLNGFAGRILSGTSRIAQGLTRSALRFIGVPYVFGGTSTYGFDCSGYTQHVFAMMGLHIPRTADAQYYAGSRIRGVMIPGDLVFFQTYEPGPSHVGIYLGNGQFVHASSSHGVMVSKLTDSYWSVRYLGAKRLASR